MDTIFDFVKREEAAYALPITVVDGWEWSMKEHIRLTTLYKNSQFSKNNDPKNRDDRPFKNIIRPILNVQYRTEGFDVKDIELFVDNEDEYYKSFIVRKYHEPWAIKHKIDDFIDEVNESRVDYGGALVRDVAKTCPEMIPLSKIAFCDQTNMLAGPLGFKHFYSPDELESFASVGWGDSSKGATVSIEEAIILAKSEQIPDAQDGKSNRTPGKYIECYEVNGVMPESWLKKGGSDEKFIRQMHILMFYTDEKGQKQGLTLYAGRAPKGMFKVVLRDKIHGRALGFGGVEELFDPQVWANYDEIVMKEMLDAVSKVLIKTNDPGLKTRHPKGLKNLGSLSIVEVDEGKDATTMGVQAPNFALFEDAAARWEDHARTMGSANEAVLGESPASGTPFKLQNLVTQQGLGLHDYRRGKYAAFIGGEVYPDWILEHISRELRAGVKFLQTLSMKELQQIAESFVQCEANKIIKEKILNGEEIVPAQVEQMKKTIRAMFMKRGSKHFLELYKDEMKDIPVCVKVSVDGKQKDLAKMTDKLVNIVRQIIAAPQILENPGMTDILNEIFEYSGLSAVDFGTAVPKPALPPPAPAVQPIASVIPKPADVPAYQ